MTKEEFLDKYGDVWVHYLYRYNYMYTYEGDLSEYSVVVVHCGGLPETSLKLYTTELSKIKDLDNIISAYVYSRGELVEGYDEQL